MTLSLPLLGVLVVVPLVVGLLLGRLWKRRSSKSLETAAPSNCTPSPLPTVAEGDRALVELLQNEWQTNIQVQMHFNDLIIKFRSMTLTAFAGLLGAAVAVGQLSEFNPRARGVVLALPLGFWIAAAFLDLGYYHRLLLGAVTQAKKFDENEHLRTMGFFGLTTTIKKTVAPFTAQVLVFLYYIVPLVIAAGISLWLYVG